MIIDVIHIELFKILDKYIFKKGDNYFENSNFNRFF